MRIELAENDSMARAAKRARASRLLVQVLAFRNYRVTNLKKAGAVYAVTFSVEGTRRFGNCDCVAGERGVLCKHIAAAAARHICAAQEMIAAQTATPAPPTAQEMHAAMDAAPVFKPTLPPAPKFRGVEL